MSIKKQLSKLARLLSVTGTVIIFALAIGAPQIAQATHLSCGAVITTDTTLDEDLTCTGAGDALIIDTNGITLDLGGFTLSGDQAGRGVIIEGLKKVTVKNGTVEGFQRGVSVRGARDVTLTHLVFTGQIDVPSLFNTNVRIFESSRAVIKHSSFIGPFASNGDSTGPNAISVFGSEDVEVNNIDAHGYVTAVNWGFIKTTDGKITNSTFSENVTSMFIGNSTGLKVSENHVSGCLDVPSPYSTCRGISLCGPVHCPGRSPEEDAVLSGITVINNHIHNTESGIPANELVDSRISGNHVHDNSFGGISLRNVSTGNRITSNLTSGNGSIANEDLFHGVNSTPNTWENNSCLTKDGADIPDC